MKRPLLTRLDAFRAATTLSALSLACLLPLTAGCGQSDATSASRAPRSGPELYQKAGCFACHGAQGGGSPFAPPLANLSNWWDRESLAAYLLEGRAGESPSDHITQLREQYKGRVMPPLSTSQASAEERLVLADWLLAR